MCIRFAAVAVLASLAASSAWSQSAHPWTPPEAATKAQAPDIYRGLVNINTTHSVGSVTAAAQAKRQRFVAAGWPPADLYLGGPNDRKENLVVRYHGTGADRRGIGSAGLERPLSSNDCAALTQPVASQCSRW